MLVTVLKKECFLKIPEKSFEDILSTQSSNIQKLKVESSLFLSLFLS